MNLLTFPMFVIYVKYNWNHHQFGLIIMTLVNLEKPKIFENLLVYVNFDDI